MMYCVIDQRPIPADRAQRRSVTCSEPCAKALAKARRDMIDRRKCRLCGAPSTPEQRKLFLQWRRETGQFSKRGRPPNYTKQPATEQVQEETQ